MKKTGTIGIVCLLIIGGFVGFISFEPKEVSATGTILYVGGTGGNNYTSIQEAIDAANPGDTVFVYSGIYNENIHVNKSINLIGKNRDTTIIDAGGNGDVVFISADNVNITGFMVKGSGHDWYDAGIKIESSSNISIIGNNVSSNEWHGIYFNYSSNNNQIINNIICNDFHGIRISGLNNSIFYNNIISNKGFGIVGGQNSFIIGNTIMYNGNGIQISFSDNNIIKNNIIYSNNEDGINLHGAYETNMINNTISLNNWSGISLFSSNNNKIIDNNVSLNNIGIDIGSYSNKNEIFNNTISSNIKDGISFGEASNENIIRKNNILFNCKWGIFTSLSSYNQIYNNNLINNINQSIDSFNTNLWNNTYPIGGNFWSDYNGIDQKSGPNQNQPGNDGIGDTHYTNISGDAGAKDNYPLMTPVSVGGVTPTMPSTPLNLKAMASNSSINLTWNSPISDGNFSINNYRIYSGNNSNNITFYTEIGNQLFYNDTNVTNGITYFYKVSAKNIIGEGPLTNEINATPKGPPLSPRILKSSAGNGYVNLSWLIPISNEGSPITNYKIYRGNSSGSESFFALIGNQLFYNDTNVTNGITYYYRISAVNAIGEGPLSNEVNATPLGPPFPFTGKVFYVGGIGPDNYTKIQTAINDAGVGDTVFVFDDSAPYYENVVIHKSINLIGENRETTIIDGGGSGDVVYINTDWVNITGFTLNNSGERGSPTNDSGIELNNVENVSILNNIFFNNQFGIYQYHSNNISIINNYILKNYYGIRVWDSINNILINNHASNNSCGFVFYNTSLFTIKNNIIFSNDGYGILFIESIGNTIMDNKISDNYDGIEFRNSNKTKIENNNIFSNYFRGITAYKSSSILIIRNNISFNNDYGIDTRMCININITNNTMLDDGIYVTGNLIEHWNTHYIDNLNTVNGKPVYFLKNYTGGIVNNGAGQVILANCSNIEIFNQTFNNCSAGIVLGFSSENIIRNNNFSNNFRGIYLKNSSFNKIYNNTFSLNFGSSISSSSSDANLIKNNYFYTIDTPLNIISLRDTTNTIITNNKMIGGGIGISGNLLEYWNTHIIDYSNTVNGKIIYYWKNISNGIIPSNAGQIILANCTNVKIKNQTLNNVVTGIELGFSSRNDISNNVISNNVFGISISSDSSNNVMYHNNFVNNEIQALDYTNSNLWNGTYPSGGNYWSDYNGTDANGDGLGDTPYIIDEDSQDDYPLMEPWDITIQKFENITITIELTKSEFYVGETITGSLHISNDNPFDIALNDQPFQMMVGIFFNIIFLDYNSEIDAVYNRNPIEVRAQSTLTIDFELYEMNTLSPEASGSVYLYLPVGNYSIYSYFYYGNESDIVTIESNHVNFRVIDKPPPGMDGDGGGSGSDDFTTSIIFASATGLVLLIIILTLFVTATEVGKYKFATIFIAPLYARELRKRKRKDEFIRGKIIGYVIGNPGDNYNTIKLKLDLTNGSLAYHLKILERKQEIRSERDGVYKRFYPYEGRVSEEVLELSKLQERIYKLIEQKPGITQTEISKQLDESVQRVNYHIQMMVDARLIKLERDGKKTKCYVIEETK